MKLKEWLGEQPGNRRFLLQVDDGGKCYGISAHRARDMLVHARADLLSGDIIDLHYDYSYGPEPIITVKLASHLLDVIPVLSKFSPRWKYIARDSDGTVRLFTNKPEKYEACWLCEGEDTAIDDIFSADLFDFVSWEDKEPVCIAEVLESA